MKTRTTNEIRIGETLQLGGRKVPELLTVIFGIALWEIIGRLDITFLLPPFSSIAAAWAEIVVGNRFVPALLLSAQTFLIGEGLAIGAGLLLGVLMGRYRAVEYFFDIWINLFMAAPISALVPIIMAVAGIGNATIVISIFLFSFFVIVVDTMAGVKQVNQTLIEMGKSFSANEFQLMTKIVLRAAMPEILTGIRLGVVRGIKGMIVGQMLISLVGFGYLITTYSYAFCMAKLYAIVLTVLVLSMLLSGLVGLLERRLVFWGRK